MVIGRLGIQKPWCFDFEYTLGHCGCKILTTPIGHFTWYDKKCYCKKCLQRICVCEEE